MLDKIDMSALSPEQKREFVKELLKSRLSGVADGLNLAPRQRGGKTRRLQDIPEEFYRFERNPGYLTTRMMMELGERMDIPNPYYRLHEGLARDTTTIGGRECINFANFNYLGLSGHAAISQAAKDAIDRYGTSVSANRIVSGQRSLHVDLEAEIARALGVEDAVVFVSAFMTNLTTIGHLFGPKDLVLHDELAHISLIQGGMLSGARRVPFPHGDWQALDRMLTDMRRQYERALIVIEGIYSMDGDIADPRPAIEIKKRHKAFLMIDEAHSMGVLGERGFGVGEHFGVARADVDIWMGTLSKAFGSCGGYVAGCRALVENLRYSAPAMVYSVGLSPPDTAAALAALKLMQAEPERMERLRTNGKLFLDLARARGLNTGFSMGVNIVPVMLGSSAVAIALSNALLERGVNVPPILYPAVAERAARLRFFLSSEHKEEQIRFAVDATAQELKRLRSRKREKPTEKI